MLIYGKKKTFYGRTDGQTDGQPKTIVRNLTKYRPLRKFFLRHLILCQEPPLIRSEKKACPPVDGAHGLVVGVQIGRGRVRRGRPQAVDALGESGRVDAPGRQQDGGVDAVGVGRRVVARLGELLLVALEELVEGALEAGQARVLLVDLRRHLLGVLQQLLEVHCGRQLCVCARYRQI